MRRITYALSALGLALTSAGGWSMRAPGSSKHLLKAATAVVNGRPEVRLRWMVTEGWLDSGRGFNVYRVEGGKRVGPLNKAPIAVNENGMPAGLIRAALVAPSPTAPPVFDFHKTLTVAKGTVPGVADSDLFKLGDPINQVVSSSSTFDALGARIHELRHAPGPGLRPAAFRMKVRQTPAIRDYLEKLEGPPVKVAAGAKLPIAPRLALRLPTAQQPQAADIDQARSTLLIGAMTNPALAQAMGLAYTDAAVTQGAAYQYVLAFVDAAGKETDVATADLTVGQDPQPAPPDGLKAAQTDADTVALYWNRASADLHARHLVLSYNVTRIDPQHPQGLRLNDLPVMKGTIPSRGAGPQQNMEPIITYRDLAAPAGQVTYRVTTVDAFARESQPATVAVTVEDWHTPVAPDHVSAGLAPGAAPAVSMSWTENPDKDALYKVYRVDVEQEKAQGAAYQPQLLTASPIPGGAGTGVAINPDGSRQTSHYRIYTDSTAVPDHYYRYQVTAVFARNNLESAEAESNVVGVPLTTGPSAPSGLAYQFKAGPPPPPPSTFKNFLGAARLSSVVTAALRAGATAPSPSATRIRLSTADNKLTTTPARSQSVLKLLATGAGVQPITVPPPNYGGALTVSWSKPADPGAPFTYRVYRIKEDPPIAGSVPSKPHGLNPNLLKLMGPRSMQSLAVTVHPPSPGPAAPSPAAGNPAPAAGASPITRRILRAGSPLSAIRAASSAQSVASAPQTVMSATRPGFSRLSSAAMQQAFKAADFITPPPLIGEVKDTAITDNILRGQLQHYRYMVIAKNRWGLESKIAELETRIPPTLLPGAPGLFSVAPVQDHRDQLRILVHANIADEDVVKYHLYRMDIPPTLTRLFNGPVSLPVTFSIGRTKAEFDQLANQVRQWIASQPNPIYSAAFPMETLAAQLAQAKGKPGDVKSYLSPDMVQLLTRLEDEANYKEVVIPGKLPAVVDHPESTDPIIEMVDTTAEPLHDCAYRVVAENSSGYLSPMSGYLDGHADKVTAVPPVLSLVSASFKTLTSASTVMLLVGGPELHVVMERAVGDGPFLPMAGAPGTPPLFQDSTVMPGHTYRYRARGLDLFGNLSDPSPELSVTVPK